MSNLHEIRLTALDGSNLLAFMAALGTLRTLSRKRPGTLLSWKVEEASGTWQPMLSQCPFAQNELSTVLHSYLSPRIRPSKEEAAKQSRAKRAFKDAEKSFKKDKKAILEDSKVREKEIKKKFDPMSASNAGKTKKDLSLEQKTELDALRRDTNRSIETVKQRHKLEELQGEWRSIIEANSPLPQFSIGEDFKVKPIEFRSFIQKSLISADGKSPVPELLQFAAAFATECSLDLNGNVVDSDLRAVGGGQTRILKEIRKIVSETSVGHLEKSLFVPWDYSDPSPAMRWDPNENRPYALRANDPASDQKRVTMRGANRLAIEAFPFFPVVTSTGRATTTGFRRTSDGLEISWPIWTDSLGMDEIRSLLCISDLSNDQPNLFSMSSRGVVQVYRSRRFGKEYRNFSPATGLL